MPVFKPDAGKTQDLGGVYSDGKIQNFQDQLIGVEPTSDHGTSGDCCEVTCFVDQSGVAYETDEDGCVVIPRVTATISGIDICSYVQENCPSYDSASFSAVSGILTLSLQDGTDEEVSIPQVVVTETLTGAGTNGDPYTAHEVEVAQTDADDVTLDLRSLCYLELGQAGPLVADAAAKDQHRFVVPEGFEIEIVRAYASLAKAGSTATTLYFYSTADAGGGVAPTPGAAASSLALGSGVAYARWSGIETTYSSLRHLQERVQTAGTGAQDFVLHIWYRMVNPTS